MSPLHAPPNTVLTAAVAYCITASKDITDFYQDPATRRLFKLHVWAFLGRENPLTGIAYKDDPTIMAWNILNEPRCPGMPLTGWQRICSLWTLGRSNGRQSCAHIAAMQATIFKLFNNVSPIAAAFGHCR